MAGGKAITVRAYVELHDGSAFVRGVGDTSHANFLPDCSVQFFYKDGGVFCGRLTARDYQYSKRVALRLASLARGNAPLAM
jgi:hypothetical protein